MGTSGWKEKIEDAVEDMHRRPAKSNLQIKKLIELEYSNCTF
jgi:hypothetical protein